MQGVSVALLCHVTPVYRFLHSLLGRHPPPLRMLCQAPVRLAQDEVAQSGGAAAVLTAPQPHHGGACGHGTSSRWRLPFRYALGLGRGRRRTERPEPTAPLCEGQARPPGGGGGPRARAAGGCVAQRPPHGHCTDPLAGSPSQRRPSPQEARGSPARPSSQDIPQPGSASPHNRAQEGAVTSFLRQSSSPCSGQAVEGDVHHTAGAHGCWGCSPSPETPQSIGHGDAAPELLG